jgi:hypothetical protein
MPPPRCRAFHVIDGMILVSAAALSCWLLKLSNEGNGRLFPVVIDRHSLTDESNVPYLSDLTRCIRQGAVPLLLPTSLALLTIRLRGPRPVVRRLARQPGFAASSATALIVSIDFVGRAVADTPRFLPYNFRHIGWFFEWYQWSLWYSHPLVGAAVAATWAVMALGGTWHTEPGWIDRSGIAVGSLWIVVLVAYCMSYDWR